MNFKKFIDDFIPKPKAYLLAGVERPNSGLHGGARNLVGDMDQLVSFLGEPAEYPQWPQSITALDEAGAPLAVATTRSSQYLLAPFSARRVTSAPYKRTPGGVLTVHTPTTLDYFFYPSAIPMDAVGVRPVTLDFSVIRTGLEASKFAKNDGIFASMALEIELAVIFRTSDSPRGTDNGSMFSWWPATPVPIDNTVLRIYRHIHSEVRTQLREGRIDRTDVLCAATAIAYESPLYTVNPDLYAPIKNGLRVIEYGPQRNKKADSGTVRVVVPPPAGLTPALTVEAVYQRGDDYTEEAGALLDLAIAQPAGLGEVIVNILDDASSDNRWRKGILWKSRSLSRVLPHDHEQHGNVIDTLHALINNPDTPTDEVELAIRALGRWGIWPDNGPDPEFFIDTEEEPDNPKLLALYGAYLTMAGISSDDVDAELAAVTAGTTVPSMERIEELRGQ